MEQLVHPCIKPLIFKSNYKILTQNVKKLKFQKSFRNINFDQH